jgi:hypothetical protein
MRMNHAYKDTATKVLALLLLPFAMSAIAATPSVKVTGTFSSLYYNEEGGDVLGTEITIVYGGKDYYALVQCAEGVPGIPVLLVAQINDLNVSFTIPKGAHSGCPETAYSGTVSKSGLKGQFDGYGKSELLKRKASYWQ